MLKVVFVNLKIVSFLGDRVGSEARLVRSYVFKSVDFERRFVVRNGDVQVLFSHRVFEAVDYVDHALD